LFFEDAFHFQNKYSSDLQIWITKDAQSIKQDKSIVVDLPMDIYPVLKFNTL